MPLPPPFQTVGSTNEPITNCVTFIHIKYTSCSLNKNPKERNTKPRTKHERNFSVCYDELFQPMVFWQHAFSITITPFDSSSLPLHFLYEPYFCNTSTFRRNKEFLEALQIHVHFFHLLRRALFWSQLRETCTKWVEIFTVKSAHCLSLMVKNSALYLHISLR